MHLCELLINFLLSLSNVCQGDVQNGSSSQLAQHVPVCVPADLPLEKLLHGLCIPSVGERTSKELAKEYTCLQEIAADAAAGHVTGGCWCWVG